ncbi:MAG: hypothetical protein H7Z17_20930, partial [Fuerstia sp.]|nr:hypothetical protein [Fuerstiella sp.]
MLIAAARGLGRWMTSSLFRSMLPGQRRRATRSGTRAPWRLDQSMAQWIECVEERTLLAAAAIIVDSLTDESDGNYSVGDVSLREAIELANSQAGTDEIRFAGSLSGGTITLGIGQLLVTDSLTITGPGASSLTVSGGNSFRVFDLQSSPNVIISGLTISGGRTTVNGQSGGGIRSTGTLQLLNSVVTNNSTTGGAAMGGGIFQINGSLTITDSTVSGNSTTGIGASGGGISAVSGGVMISGSTISGNTSTAHAGGVAFDSNGSAVTATIINSTVSGNSTTGGFGGGIFNARGTLNLQHSTVTLNSAPDGNGSGLASASNGTTIADTVVLSSIISANTNSDIDNILTGTGTNTVTSSGFNLIGAGNAITSFDQASDLTDVTDPQLAPLANNGGPTRTHALLEGSAAIGAGDTASTATTDQRGLGFARLVGERADIGAFELPASNPTVTLSVNRGEIVETGGVATISAILSEPSGEDVTVVLGFTGTATIDDDYFATSVEIFIPAGATFGAVAVAALEDAIDDNSESVIVDIAGVTNATESGAQQVTTIIYDRQTLIVSPTAVSVTEGLTNTFTVKLVFQPAANVTVAVARVSGDTDLTVNGDTSMTFTSANWSTPQTVILAAAEDVDSGNGSALFNVTSPGLTTVSVTGTEADDDAQFLVVSATAVTVT